MDYTTKSWETLTENGFRNENQVTENKIGFMHARSTIEAIYLLQ